MEFAVEEIPPSIPDLDDPDLVPLARLEPGSVEPGQFMPPAASDEDDDDEDDGDSAGETGRPARIVLYRRPLIARADGEEELAELVLDVIVEQFARWLGVDPQTVDPGYPAED